MEHLDRRRFLVRAAAAGAVGWAAPVVITRPAFAATTSAAPDGSGRTASGALHTSQASCAPPTPGTYRLAVALTSGSTPHEAVVVVTAVGAVGCTGPCAPVFGPVTVQVTGAGASWVTLTPSPVDPMQHVLRAEPVLGFATLTVRAVRQVRCGDSDPLTVTSAPETAVHTAGGWAE